MPGGWADQLVAAKDPSGAFIFKNDSNLTHALVVGTDPRDAAQPAPLPHEVSPDDPLCRVPV